MRVARVSVVVLVLMVAALLGHLMPSARAQVTPQTPAADKEQTVWNLERSYWRHVQENDLPPYRTLWDKDFLGWPGMSAQPLRKDHITDWITSETSKGLRLKTFDLRPAAIQTRGSLATTCYWISYRWIDQEGKSTERISRVIHTWLNDGGTWQIISGMSMPVTAIP